MGKPDPLQPPTVDEWCDAAIKLARLLRKAFNAPHSVKRETLLRALKRFESLDDRAL